MSIWTDHIRFFQLVYRFFLYQFDKRVIYADGEPLILQFDNFFFIVSKDFLGVFFHIIQRTQGIIFVSLPSSEGLLEKQLRNYRKLGEL